MEDKFSIIIPTLQKDLNILNKLVEELIIDDYVGEIIIIDNSLLGYENPSNKLKVITPKENIFVNPAWNLGIENAKYPYFGILNDDLLLPKDFCRQVLEFIKTTKNCGLVGLESSTTMQCDNKTFNEIPPSGHLKFRTLKHIYDNKNWFWGSAIWGETKNYHIIPDEMKVYSGDNYLLKINNDKKKKNYAIYNIKVKHYGSLSSSSPKLKKIKANDQKYMATICPHYKKYQEKLKKERRKKQKDKIKNTFIENIFSLKNSKNKKHKIITILGLKFKVRRRAYERK